MWFLVFDSLKASADEIVFLNVGQGDALLLKMGRVNILIDAGPSKKVVYELDKVLPIYRRRLDLAISTHPHIDHMGGFFDIFKKYKVRGFISSGIVHYDPNVALGLKEVLDFSGAKNITLKANDKIFYKDNKLLFLWPRTIGGVREDNLDDFSLIIRFYKKESLDKLGTYKATAIFMADAGNPAEQKLIESFGKNLKTAIIKIGHHGSKKSTSDYFLEAVGPSIAVISVGKNTYGHPNKEVLDRIKEKGIKLLRTDIDGTIRLKI